MKSASHSGGSPGIVIVPGAMAFTPNFRRQRLRQHFRQHHQRRLSKRSAECNPGQPSIPPVSAQIDDGPSCSPQERRRRLRAEERRSQVCIE